MHNDSIIKALFFFPVFFAVVFLWGYIILQKILKLKLKISIENSVFIVCTGFVFTHQFMFVLGAFKLLYPFTVYMGLFPVLIYSFFDRGLYLEIKKALVVLFFQATQMSVLQKIIIGGVFSIALTFFWGSLTSPIGGQGNDVLRYHFSALKEFVRYHGFVYMPDIIHTNSPFAVDFLFLPGFILGGVLSAQLTSWILFCCLVISVFGLSKTLIENSFKNKQSVYPEFSAVLVAITPLFFRFSDTCLIDNGLTLFVVVSVWAFYMFVFSNNIKWIFLSSAFLGMAVGSKYTALFLLPGFLFSYIVIYGKKVLTKKAISISFIILFIVVSIGGLWYVKNYIYTGNPVFPAFYNIFGGNEYWSNRANLSFAGYVKIRGMGMGKSFVSLLLVPWNFTIYSEKFHNWQTITPLYLSLSPAIVFIIKKKIYYPLMAISFIFSMLWFYFDQEARLIAPIIPFFAIMIHAGLEVMFLKYGKVKKYIQILVIISMSFSVLLAVKHLRGNLPVLTGKISNLEFQKQNVDFPKAYELINSTMKAGEKILMIKGSTECGLVRYFVDKEAMIFIPGIPEMCGFKCSVSDLDNFLEEVREKKFNYILDVEDHIKDVELKNKGISVIGSSKNWKLYRVLNNGD